MAKMRHMKAPQSPPQIWSLFAYLESRGGTVDVSGAAMPDASPSTTGGGGGGGSAGGLAGGSTDPKTIIQAAGCLGCHTLDGQGGRIAPDLTHVGAHRSTESIRKKILAPISSIPKGH